MLHNIIFSNNLFVICLLLGLFFSSLLYYNQRKNLKSSILYYLSIFRFILITLLSFLLLDPVVKSENKITEQPIVVILQDGSSSIQQNIFKQLNDLSKKLSGYDVYNYNFSDKLYSDFTSENNGLITDFSKALGQVKSIFSNRNLSSIVLASDGLNNTGLNPLFSDNLEVPMLDNLNDMGVLGSVKVISMTNLEEGLSHLINDSSSSELEEKLQLDKKDSPIEQVTDITEVVSLEDDSLKTTNLKSLKVSELKELALKNNLVTQDSVKNMKKEQLLNLFSEN